MNVRKIRKKFKKYLPFLLEGAKISLNSYGSAVFVRMLKHLFQAENIFPCNIICIFIFCGLLCMCMIVLVENLKKGFQSLSQLYSDSTHLLESSFVFLLSMFFLFITVSVFLIGYDFGYKKSF